MWVRGLKHLWYIRQTKDSNVAPYVGAWIETISESTDLHVCRSHPMWVRGLKLIIDGNTSQPIMSHPMWVRGLKLNVRPGISHNIKSHPMWVRGLKLNWYTKHFTCRLSHPMWVRGLKHRLPN